ncbi:hypothetical protein STIAU_0188 [Stigmatella aurantiaca DW4/3-1]|uniref:Choice-of-anchor A domain-containing protein n=1 Tax=Stigmatella aurantiaca (strain DW4/3-1) TaxID=378806 RepID=Q08W57_STIAD|nr:hypothetical protein STIAU_0188 [Stigmatella aurantiaca DW4/3-1]
MGPRFRESLLGAAAGPSECIEVRLGEYNVFLLEDYTFGTDVEGRVAAGGNIAMNHFSVGRKVPESLQAQSVVAGGDLLLSNGAVWGNAWHGGLYTPRSSVTFAGGTALQGTPIDFTARSAELRGLSVRLAALPANATVAIEPWGGIQLLGTEPDVNVFEVPASAFHGAKVLAIDAPAGSLAVINIRGSSATFRGFGLSLSGGIDSRDVLYHFVDTWLLDAEGYGFAGTVLAPRAHITFFQGSFHGGIYARSLTGNASGHLHALRDRDLCP